MIHPTGGTTAYSTETLTGTLRINQTVRLSTDCEIIYEPYASHIHRVSAPILFRAKSAGEREEWIRLMNPIHGIILAESDLSPQGCFRFANNPLAIRWNCHNLLAPLGKPAFFGLDYPSKRDD